MINPAILDFRNLKWLFLKSDGWQQFKRSQQGLIHHVDGHFHYSPRGG
jgi:hypothetical protein